jgi:hypothetical protein
MLISGDIRDSCQECNEGWSVFEIYRLQDAGIYILNVLQ